MQLSANEPAMISNLFNTMYNKTISLYVCMAIKHIIVLFVEIPRKFIAAVINLRVFPQTKLLYNKTIIEFSFCDMQNYQGLSKRYQPRFRLG
jgi:hypothetical protein